MASGEEERQGWERFEALRWEEAEQHFRRALEDDPFRPDALTGIAALYLKAGEPEQARELCEMALAQAERDLPRAKRHTGWEDDRIRPYVRALYYLALTYIEQDAWALAQPALEEVVAWDITGIQGKALDLLGQVLQRINRLEEATHAYLEAAEYLPESYFSAGLVLFLRGKLREAERFWQRGIEHRPELARWLMEFPWVQPLPILRPDDEIYNRAVQYIDYLGELWTFGAKQALASVFVRQRVSIG
ncbi:hypothetical protein TPY_3515 [Sulfobacillus acidophilus TPY]|uniref:Tetratricopeptide TPR_1 repeat-containing protein n=1 Tax=Sulfobacillus acidophilus (strain ATCC 700253 / DSM 10332 / NAL) TaxID=679936 RepID=G8TWJ9_SULAD|nr:hypothetical protein TPY_3515 [Sulfobacillus acidophilus TPY]AEW04897.1 Tetratricopeptide TPR_1 repeat-containing protein [Sulfobacillus acidophilus DSM 10332]MCY0864983.1 tetratricopeptide repeat protein [Sulfobacillus sp.]